MNTKTSQIGIYVLKNDAAQTIEDAKDYTFGTLSSLDKKNTQEAVKQIQTLLGQPVKQQSADGVTKLVDSLMDGSCGVIILNHAYLPILSEMEGYTDIENKIRELDILDVNTVIEEQTKDTNVSQKQDAKNIIRLYISGIDTRGGEIINTRSDVNIIATINTDTKQMLLVSTPRDYFVPLSISNGVPDKLTHAGIYGIDVSMDTLGMLYDISLDKYFSIEGCFDTNFSYDRMAELVRQQLEDGGSWNIVSYSVDGTGDTRQPYSMSANAYVMIPDQTTVDEAKALMQQVVDGEVIDLNK